MYHGQAHTRLDMLYRRSRLGFLQTILFLIPITLRAGLILHSISYIRTLTWLTHASKAAAKEWQVILLVACSTERGREPFIQV